MKVWVIIKDGDTYDIEARDSVPYGGYDTAEEANDVAMDLNDTDFSQSDAAKLFGNTKSAAYLAEQKRLRDERRAKNEKIVRGMKT
jgi:hypothetical protein